MNTLLKSAGGITQVSADSRLLSNRLIFLEGKIDAGSAGEFVRQILIRRARRRRSVSWSTVLVGRSAPVS